MRPLVICGTCKELYKCANLLEKFGYIPVNCRIPTCDNHLGGFLILNREGEFRFSTCNYYSNFTCMVTATDFLKSYGGLGIRSPYDVKNIYFACTLGLLFTKVFAGLSISYFWIIGTLLINIPIHFKTIKTWFDYGRKRKKN